MIKLNDIHPLTGFLGNHKDHFKRLKNTGRPEVLTINGEAQLIVQDAKAYQAILDRLEYAETIDILRKEVAAMNAGEPGFDLQDVVRDAKKAIQKSKKV